MGLVVVEVSEGRTDREVKRPRAAQKLTQVTTKQAELRQRSYKDDIPIWDWIK